MANRSDALQSSRRSQCSSASVRTTWLYRPDPIQCLTSIRVSDSRHNYGKTAATVRMICDPVQTRFSLRQESQFKFNRLDASLPSSGPLASDMEIVDLTSTFRTPASHGPDARTTDMEIAC
jgi:hypothetical protein